MQATLALSLTYVGITRLFDRAQQTFAYVMVEYLQYLFGLWTRDVGDRGPIDVDNSTCLIGVRFRQKVSPSNKKQLVRTDRPRVHNLVHTTTRMIKGSDRQLEMLSSIGTESNI
jgi:hypothetical protein